MDDAENVRSIRNREWRAAVSRDSVGNFKERGRNGASRLFHEIGDRIGGAFAEPAPVNIDSAHSRVGGEGNKLGFMLAHCAAAQAVFLLSQYDYRAPFRSFIGEAGELRRVR